MNLIYNNSLGFESVLIYTNYDIKMNNVNKYIYINILYYNNINLYNFKDFLKKI